MKNNLSIPPILQFGGIITLLLSVLILPLLHLHPAYDHVHGEAEGHQHQVAVHADFFPDTTHGHEHHDDHDPHDSGLGGEVETDASPHAFSQIDLFALHIGQSFQFSSVFKKNPHAFVQASLDLSILPRFQRRAFYHQNAPPRRGLRFSPPSLRAPPYYA